MTDQQRISSNRAFIMAIAGAAIGLGNIWRFPYVVGENGGSLFFLAYLLFVVIMGLPVMIAEIVLGRAGRASPAISFRQLALANGRSRHWSKVAGAGTVAAALILSFYSVVAGWVLFYFGCSLTMDASMASLAGAEQQLKDFLSSPGLVIFGHTLFIVMTMVVSARQVSHGIERLNNYLMPLMYLILVVLVVYTVGFPGFPDAVHYLFGANGESINWTLITEAMGHAFFTLAIGACCLMAYGAYMPENQSILKAVGMVAFMDVLVAIMVGLASFSVVFSEGMMPDSGPGLMFVALPVALHHLPMGTWILPLFFLLLVFAAWTSSINLAEPLVVFLSRVCQSRIKGALSAGFIVWVSGLIPALSFNVFGGVTLPSGKSLFDVYTALPTLFLLPVTGFLILIFSGYVMNRQCFFTELRTSIIIGKVIWGLIRYISPVLVFIVLVFGIFFSR